MIIVIVSALFIVHVHRLMMLADADAAMRVLLLQTYRGASMYDEH